MHGFVRSTCPRSGKIQMPYLDFTVVSTHSFLWFQLPWVLCCSMTNRTANAADLLSSFSLLPSALDLCMFDAPSHDANGSVARRRSRGFITWTNLLSLAVFRDLMLCASTSAEVEIGTSDGVDLTEATGSPHTPGSSCNPCILISLISCRRSGASNCSRDLPGENDRNGPSLSSPLHRSQQHGTRSG